MKKLILYLLILPIITGFSLSSCIEDDFTTASTDVLSFSTDTIMFDTIFTDYTTPTAVFKVFNRSKKMINISTISVAGDSRGRFSLNVDGIKGETLHNIEIRGGDSIFVFVDAYINPSDNNNPIEIKDRILFVTNGVTQEVNLIAWGQDVVRLRGACFDSDTVLSAERPYVVFDTLRVGANATLTLQPGVTLYFHDKGAIEVAGRLIAQGTQDSPINMRGDRTDNVAGDIDYEIMSGQWGGITFLPTSSGNEMHYVFMRGSSNGIVVDSCGIESHSLYIFNSRLHNASNSVLTSRHSRIEAIGTEFSDAGGSVVDIEGGTIRMLHCTFANYYLFSAIRGPILNLSHLKEEENTTTAPLLSGTIDNCIIYGNGIDFAPTDLTGSKIYVRNTLMKSPGSNDDYFIDCVWEGDPKFYTIRSDYYFDYRLKEDSQAIGIANPEFTIEECRYDRYGNDRLASEKIDAGAYAFRPDAE